jgi:hypothetical protein
VIVFSMSAVCVIMYSMYITLHFILERLILCDLTLFLDFHMDCLQLYVSLKVNIFELELELLHQYFQWSQIKFHTRVNHRVNYSFLFYSLGSF